MSEIYGKMVAVMKEIGAVEKTRSSGGGLTYPYRGIDDVMAALQPALAKHGVICVPTFTTVEKSGTYTTKNKVEMNHVVLVVSYTFYAEDGSKITCTVTGEGSDAGDKACNKAMAGAMKYAITQTFSIPTHEDKDSEHFDVGERAPAPQDLGPSRPIEPLNMGEPEWVREPSAPAPAPPVPAPGSAERFMDTVLGFGKYRDKTWRDMTDGSKGGDREDYLRFIMESFDKPEIKEKARLALQVKAQREEGLA